jgi:proline iminopeptidase
VTRHEHNGAWLAAERTGVAMTGPAGPMCSAGHMPRADAHVRHVVFPPIEPRDCGHLDVGDGHSVYWELCGNPCGKPAVVLHGGPGAGCHPDLRRFFDPDRYCVVLVDQRGCGRSRPHGSVEANTTWHLVSDLERLRKRLGIRQWLVFGGSWGCTLALAYSQAHPERVSEMVLWGVFTARRSETAWLCQDGASRLFPDLWERFLTPIPDEDRGDVLAAYRRLLGSPERGIRLVAARAWAAWETGIATMVPRPPTGGNWMDDDECLALAAIGVHYLTQGCFLDEGQLIRDAGRLAAVSGTIVQGRHDVVTPMQTAWQLSRAWPGSELLLIPDAGHASSEPSITHQLLEAVCSYSDGERSGRRFMRPAHFLEERSHHVADYP